jgi:hypothetical protein
MMGTLHPVTHSNPYTCGSAEYGRQDRRGRCIFTVIPSVGASSLRAQAVGRIRAFLGWFHSCARSATARSAAIARPLVSGAANRPAVTVTAANARRTTRIHRPSSRSRASSCGRGAGARAVAADGTTRAPGERRHTAPANGRDLSASSKPPQRDQPIDYAMVDVLRAA